jgi:alkylation response protein AidB-like acyl-CoA dehydrogenase
VNAAIDGATAGTGPGIWLDRVGALAPAIDTAAEAIERDRRVPADLMRALHDAGLFRILLPRRYGGAEVHPLVFMQVLEALAKHDASLAWNLGQNSVCSIVAAYLQPDAARQVFGPRDAILAWGPANGPVRATACDGGYRVSGRWSFASGMRHATWLGAQCPLFEADGSPRRNASGAHEKRTMLVPARSATLHDVWNVGGLRGTASDAFVIEDCFVPEALTVDRESLRENREPGALYRLTTFNLFSCGFGSVALGVARAMLDAFVELAKAKTARGMPGPLRDNTAVQAQLGRAEARLRAARHLLFGTMTEICGDDGIAAPPTMEQRMAIRLASTQAIREARSVGGFAFEAAGATAIFTSGPFDRRFRDLNTIAQQVQGRASHYDTVGRFLLGAEGDASFT